MSKILELAQAVEDEIQELRCRTVYIEHELIKEKEKHKKFLKNLKCLIEEELHDE